MRKRPANVLDMVISMLGCEVLGFVIVPSLGGVTLVLRVPPMFPVLRVPPMFPVVLKPAMLPAMALEDIVTVSARARIVGLSIFILVLL